MTERYHCCIEGILTIDTPLHIGSGESIERQDAYPGLVVEDETGKKKPVEIDAVMRDQRDLPYLPGSAIKGALHAYLQSKGVRQNLVDAVFGSEARGGKAEFWEASLIDKLVPIHEPPHWNDRRQTGVEAGVTLDRVTGAAREKRLFYQEIVPPHASFCTRISGHCLNEDEIALLLVALEGFNGDSPVTLGAETGSGKGRMIWRLQQIRAMNRQDVLHWLATPQPPMALDAAPALSAQETSRLWQMGMARLRSCQQRSALTLTLAIHFDSPFLVSDPAVKNSKDADKQESTPDHRPRRDEGGKAFLPAKSLRGALRSQAERIIRTLAGEGNACYVDDPTRACKPIQEVGQQEKLCFACQAFGAPGWRSPLEISDFRLSPGTGRPMAQFFNAIDRFTGGGASGRLYQIEAIHAPELAGTLQLDIARADPWVLGLLVLVLRDWMEGDISLGYGAAKGYGSCHVQLLECTMTDPVSSMQWIARLGPPPLGSKWEAILQTPAREMFRQCVERFRERLIEG